MSIDKTEASPERDGFGLTSLLESMKDIRSGNMNFGNAFSSEAGTKFQELIQTFLEAFTKGDFSKLQELFDPQKQEEITDNIATVAKEIHVAYTGLEKGAGKPVVNTDAPLDPGAKTVELVSPDGTKTSLEEGFNKEVQAQGVKRIETPIEDLAKNNAALEQSQNKPPEDILNMTALAVL